MKKIKVLHINTFDSFGGAAQVAIDLLHHMDEESHLVVSQKSSADTKVIELKRNLFDYFLYLSDKLIWKLGSQKSLRTFLNLDNEANGTYNKLKRLKEYQEADIIHLHNLHGGYFDFDALIKIASEKKIVWTLHDMWAFTGGDAYTFENENYKKGVGYTPYISNYPMLSPFKDKRQHFLNKKKGIYAKIYDSIVMVTVSNWLDKCLKASYVYNEKLKVRRIYNGFDSTVFINKNKRTWSKPRLLFFNLPNPFKGSKLFTDIIDQLKNDYELFIIGEKIKTTVPVTYLDYIKERDGLNNLYNNVDILIFPSRAESFGLTVLEAMACGVCVVASDAGGITEFLNDQAGYIFTNNDSGDLLIKLREALSNLELSRKKGLAAEKLIYHKFTVENTCNQYRDLYKEILNENIAGDTREPVISKNVRT